MSKITTAINLLKHNRGEFFASILMHLNFLFPDRLYLSLLFRFKMGYWMDWKNPKTFSEKLQWLKLYDRNPEYSTMVDKYAVKEYVSRIIGEEYIIPTLGVWDSPEDIDWDSLPHKFVLKTTHGGGGSGVVICRDKGTFDKANAIAILKRSLSKCIYKSLREWPYKNVSKKVVAEVYLEDNAHEVGDYDLKDYKFFCFNGEPKIFKIDFDRFIDHHANYYDVNGTILPFGEVAPSPVYERQLEIPNNLSEMLAIARNLAQGLPFARVDLYNLQGKIKFGEITLFPTSGFGKFTDPEWDLRLGSWLELPNK